MNETFSLGTMHQHGMQLMSVSDIKALIPARCERLTVEDIAKKRVANRIMQARKRCKLTWDVLQKHFVGAGLDRDYDLRTYARSIQHSIMNDKGRWLPKYIFRDRPPHLFWVAGTSKAILYNFIPKTDADVYLVADASLIVNYDILCNKLLFVKDMPNRCRFICENTIVYQCDIVQTNDAAIAEHNAEKIAHFAKYKESFQ